MEHAWDPKIHVQSTPENCNEILLKMSLIGLSDEEVSFTVSMCLRAMVYKYFIVKYKISKKRFHNDIEISSIFQKKLMISD